MPGSLDGFSLGMPGSISGTTLGRGGSLTGEGRGCVEGGSCGMGISFGRGGVMQISFVVFIKRSSENAGKDFMITCGKVCSYTCVKI